MDTPKRFRKANPNIIHERFDDETVIVNLDNGNYYSFNHVGSNVWSLVESGLTVNEIIDRLNHSYEENHINIESSVHQFLGELQQEKLIVPRNGDKSTLDTKSVPDAENTPDGEKPMFTAPELQKYTDMQELLLLDPIHEVDETGWPSKKTAEDG